MKIYVVAGRYLRTQDEARKHAKEAGVPFNPDRDFDDVPVSPAADLVAYLNNLVQGLAAGPRAADPAVVLATNAPVPLHNSTMVDEAFEGLPITHQLTLTALALENARDEIGRLQAAAKKAAGPVITPEDLGPTKRFDTVEELMTELNSDDDDAEEFV